MGRIGAAVLWAGLAVFGNLGAAVPPSHALCLGEGQPAPEFALETLDGDVVRLSALRGKPVLLVFWATWCPRCMEQLAFLQGLHTSLGDRLTILAVNQETQLLSPAHVTRLRQELEGLGIDLAVPLDRDLAVWKAYCIGALPTTVILDRQGLVRFAEPNFYWASREKIETVLRDLDVPVR
ncbi:MAG: TlpA family protein disulfide reductase [Proteobacteria bacterium]|nr:TlpA family protein disulfide reductase [Pseudomonadota bacterium]